MKRVSGWILAIAVSIAIGTAVRSFYPSFTLWFLFECDKALSMILVMGLFLASCLPPLIPAAIAHWLGVRGNKVLAAICALMIGVPIIGTQASNWNLYAATRVETFSSVVVRMEGAESWSALYCVLVPGVVFVLVTFFAMAFEEGNTKASDVYKDKQKALERTFAQAALVRNQAALVRNPQFVKRGRKYLIWSIINTVYLFVFVLPILALRQSIKAQKAQTSESHEHHIKLARIFNLLSYAPLLILAAIPLLIVAGVLAT